MPTQRPVLRANFESSVPGLYVIGDLAGAPVVKLAMEQGSDVAEYIAATLEDTSQDPNIYDVIVIGAGAAGLNAALGAQDRGLRVLALEKNKIANTIEDFPEGIYAEKRVSKQFASQRMASSRLRLAASAITPFRWCWPRGSATIHATWA